MFKLQLIILAALADAVFCRDSFFPLMVETSWVLHSIAFLIHFNKGPKQSIIKIWYTEKLCKDDECVDNFPIAELRV